MPDPTHERVGELLEEWRADKAAGGYEANSYDLAQHLADEYGPLAESWQRQSTEIEALTALVRRSKDALARWNSHVDFELMCDIDEALRATPSCDQQPNRAPSSSARGEIGNPEDADDGDK